MHHYIALSRYTRSDNAPADTLEPPITSSIHLIKDRLVHVDITRLATSASVDNLGVDNLARFCWVSLSCSVRSSVGQAADSTSDRCMADILLTRNDVDSLATEKVRIGVSWPGTDGEPGIPQRGVDGDNSIAGRVCQTTGALALRRVS